MKQVILAAVVCALAGGFLSVRLRTSLGQVDKDNEEAQQTYRAYVQAWKLKDIAALRNLIADDYLAVNFEGKVSDKENEIATAEADAEWTSMTVDEIHTRIFGNTAIASGFISAQGKRKDGNTRNTAIFYVFGLWRMIPPRALAKSIVVASLIKVGVKFVLLPLTIKVSLWLKRIENVDYFDAATNFNPLKF